MTSLLKLLTGLALLAGPLGFLHPESRTTPEAPAKRLNVLVLLADDMRADAIAAYGNPHISTPAIDGLIKRGFSFRENYIFGGNNGAVCIPSRAMLMSGRTWLHIDTENLAREMLLPEYLRRNGFQTFATGKWHNGQSSWLRAFERGRTVMFGGMSDHTRVPVRDLSPRGELSAERIGEKFSSELFADSAIDFLKTRDRSRPFLAYVAFTAPHDPRQPPAEYREMYYRNLPPLPSNFRPQFPFDNGMVKNLRDENLAAWPRTEKIIREQLAEYYGLITHMDRQIDRILSALKESGDLDNTLIVFAADNGLALGSHGLLGKQNVFEHSMKVPLVIAGPGIPRGKSSSAFSYLLDLFPTVCEVEGLPVPEGLDGFSLKPVWEGRKTELRDSIFLPYLGIQRAVRDRRWKLISYPRQGHIELFDLQRDPGETIDIAERAESQETIRRLRGLMSQWQRKAGDTLTIPEGNRKPAAIDLTGTPRKPDASQPDWIIRKYFDAP